MLDFINKIIDAVEDVLLRENPSDPDQNNKLIELGARLESMALDIRNRTTV